MKEKAGRNLPVLPAVPGFVLPALARWTHEESMILADENAPFRSSFELGDDRLLLIAGDNASGKSLAFRLISQLCGQNRIEAMTLSVRERTGGGTFDMSRMRQALIFGEEETSSTGAISARVVRDGYRNLVGRHKPAILGLDEPELGLSEGYARALGEYIGLQARNIRGNVCGVMVVTHSRCLAQGILLGLGETPTFLGLSEAGCNPAPSVQAWIDDVERRSVEDLLSLPDRAHANFKRVNQIIGK